MKTYKTIAKDKTTGKKVVIEEQARTKAEFIEMLRKNDYAVNPLKVKVKEVFEYIMENTNCYDWDWKINSIPTD